MNAFYKYKPLVDTWCHVCFSSWYSEFTQHRFQIRYVPVRYTKSTAVPVYLIFIISAASFSDQDREDGSQQSCSASRIKEASTKTSSSYPL